MTKEIKKAIDALPPRKKWNGWMTREESSRIVKRGNEYFAVYGTQARKLIRSNTDECLILPAIYKGKIMAQFPEEGRSGVLHVFYLKKRKKWGATYMHCGWVHTFELELNNQQIADNIAEEILAGENVITQKPAGWK